MNSVMMGKFHFHKGSQGEQLRKRIDVHVTVFLDQQLQAIVNRLLMRKN